MYDNYIQPAHRSTHIYHTTSTTSSRLIGQLTTSSPLIGQLRSTTPTISSRLIGQLTTSSPLIGQLRSTTSTTSSRLIGQLTTSSPLIGQLRTTTPRPLHPARSSVNSYLPHHLHYIQPSHWLAHYIQPADWSAQIHHAHYIQPSHWPAHYIQPAHWSAQIHHATPTTSSPLIGQLISTTPTPLHPAVSLASSLHPARSLVSSDPPRHAHYIQPRVERTRDTVLCALCAAQRLLPARRVVRATRVTATQPSRPAVLRRRRRRLLLCRRRSAPSAPGFASRRPTLRLTRHTHTRTRTHAHTPV